MRKRTEFHAHVAYQPVTRTFYIHHEATEDGVLRALDRMLNGECAALERHGYPFRIRSSNPLHERSKPPEVDLTIDNRFELQDFRNGWAGDIDLEEDDSTALVV